MMDALINRLSKTHSDAKVAANKYTQALKAFDSEKIFVNQMLKLQTQPSH